MRRHVGCLLALATIAVAASSGGCGAEEAAHAAIALRAAGRAATYVASEHVPPGTLRDLGLVLGSGLTDGAEIETTLNRIAVSDEPYGKALTIAMCTGLAQVAKAPDDATPPDGDAWASFLEDEVATLLPNSSPAIISQKVEELNTAIALAQVSPPAARTYVQSCVAHEG